MENMKSQALETQTNMDGHCAPETKYNITFKTPFMQLLELWGKSCYFLGSYERQYLFHQGKKKQHFISKKG
jgi:hypothetical protein